MSIKNFKFVSPGVFINEIDNSFIPRSAQAIGPVVIGRATRGLGMTPVKVESYSDFVTMFGDTVPGGQGGDISRDGNFQSPMYGTYAAKAFLNANVAPLTYIRLLGHQDSAGSSDGVAGWQTTKGVATTFPENGGAVGLWVWLSSSATMASATTSVKTDRWTMPTASLAAIFYQNTSASLFLTGTILGTGSDALVENGTDDGGAGNRVRYGAIYESDSTGQLQMYISGGDSGDSTVTFTMDDSLENFARKQFNTNPQLTSARATFYPSASHLGYWLGQSYEQTIRDNSLIGVPVFAVTLPLVLAATTTTAPSYQRNASTEAKTGWFIGQQLGGAAESYSPQGMQKLFRLHGRGHGAWLNRNVKVSISNLRQSTSTVSNYGTFSVLIRKISDTDNNVEIMERYDNCTLDPTSVNFVGRKIGDKYAVWDTTERRLKTYGDYDNQSRFVYVEMNADVEAGASDPLNLPFGYFGPPKFSDIIAITGSWQSTPVQDSFIRGAALYGGPALTASIFWGNDSVSAGQLGWTTRGQQVTGSLSFPYVRLRASASDGGLSDPTKAAFGMQTTRTADSTRYDVSVPDFHTPLYGGYTGGGVEGSTTGVDDFAYIFSMNDVGLDATTSTYHWVSGARAAGNAVDGYTTLLDAGYDSFTAPVFGGFDGFDIKVPDPVYNRGIPGAGGSGTGTATELNSYVYYTIKRAIDTVSDPEAVDMNLLTIPGLTQEGLTQHMIDVSEARADTLALIDLPDVYVPPAERYYDTKQERIATTPTLAANALQQRGINSSYGATFYPWVQTRDELTGRLLWIPPTIAMMGVLASSQRKTAIWFAPAGFNRGGLSDGAAGIPVTGVSERLTSTDRDKLYESRINPIASFPSSGIVVFGQKTLQQQRSALDRINVRRLVIYLKKQISILSTQVLFEQNVQATWNRFTSLIEPLLANTKASFGITDYRLILDETTTTPDLIDQNVLYAKIMIKPARAIEYIAIDFVIMSTGASFDD